MEIELLNAMNQNLQHSALTILKLLVMVNFSLAVVGFIVYVTGVTRLFLAKTSVSDTVSSGVDQRRNG
ncbi:MAG: hypothetical protein JNK38_02490 [Acidobacteria bacterium]|nr:hypothetical protein [Acidobacteriota bacterium]